MIIDRVFIANKKNQDIINEYIDYYKAKRGDEGYSERTIRAIDSKLRKLSDYCQKNTNHKNIRKTTEDELIKFFTNKIYVTVGSHNLTGAFLIPFYRWVHKVGEHSRPKNIDFFKASTKRTKKRLRDPNRLKNLFITPEEYGKIMNYGKDIFNQENAMWETYYLSGFRPEELESMRICDVNEDPKTKIVSISCSKSKTWPRTIKLTEYPYNLIRYIGNHPLRKNRSAPLWFKYKNAENIEQLDIEGIRERWRKLRKKLDIPQTKKVKSFRKTRASIWFNARSKDGGLIYTHRQIGKYFGWEESTVTLRERDYDLSDDKALEKIILSKPIIPKSFDTLDIDNKTIREELENEIKILKKKSTNNYNKWKQSERDYTELHELLEENRDNNIKGFNKLKENLDTTLSYISDVVNKQLFTIDFKIKYKNNKVWKNLKEMKELMDKEYKNYPNKIEFKSLDDVKHFREYEVKPKVNELIKKN